MSYHNYTTEGIVLKGRPVGEADKYFYILTKDLGLIIASAKSVRKSESKLSCGLEDFSQSTFSFIRGKHSWKVTSAQPITNSYRFLSNDLEKRLLWARFLSLVQRMVTGEEKHIAIFSICQNLFSFLISGSYSEKQLLAIESLAILKLLNELGYVISRPEYTALLEDQSFSIEVVASTELIQRRVLEDINKALKESHL
jgi:DNA repair protein RecO (recombination protein O)